MPKHKYNIHIDAPSEKEADDKMQAVTTLLSKLSTEELQRLAHMLKHDPVKTAMAKKALMSA